MKKYLLIISCLILFFPLASANLTDDLVAYWNFDETNGNLIDQYGIFDGTLMNGITQGDIGILNNAYNFDGSNDYINIENRIQLIDQASFSFWINAEDTINRRGIISKRIVGGNDWQININGNEIYFYLWGTNNEVHQIPFSTTNEWKHIAVIYDGTSVKIYVNNLKVYDEPNSGNINNFAQYTIIGDDFSDNFYDGKIDEFGIWKRTLTPDEISILYNNVSIFEQKAEELREQVKELEEQQRKENLKKLLMFLLIVVLVSAPIFYFHQKGKKKREKRITEILERKRVERIKREKEERRRKRLEAEKEKKEKLAKEKFEKSQREKGLDFFEGKWMDKKAILKLKEIQIGLDKNFQNLSPYDFEKFIAKLFQAMGYETRVTQASNDYGIDVVAKRGNEKIAIQCKRYRPGSPVSNRDVQRLLGAMQLRSVRATHSIIITTSHFTVQAREQAKECAIELWERHDLHKMVQKYLMEI